MQFVKGFVIINELVSNIPGIITPLGELSTWSTTYSREKGEYTSQNIQGFKFIAFKSVDNDGKKVAVEQGITNEIIAVVDYLMKYAKSRIGPYDRTQLANKLLVDFHGVVGSITMGILGQSDTMYLPEWLSWTSLGHANSKVKIWLSDPAFQEEYDDYEIEVIPPIKPIDELFNSFEIVKSRIANITLQNISDSVVTTKGINPETFLRVFEFDLVNKFDAQQTIKVPWTVLVYGKAGDNIDSIKDAMVDYITKNTKKPLDEWRTLIPEIFKRTEFIIIPRWDKLSVHNLTDMASLYGSIMDPNECKTFANSTIDFYTSEWISSHVNIVPYDYKAITLLIIPGPNNISGNQELIDIVPDYIPVSTSSIDFGRMEVPTREWSAAMERLIISAEITTEFSSIPTDMRKVRRSNKLYLSFMLDNVNYLIFVRNNLFPITPDESGVITI